MRPIAFILLFAITCTPAHGIENLDCSKNLQRRVIALAMDAPKNPCSIGWVEKVLGFCEHSAESSPVCEEAKEIVIRERGSIGKRVVFDNGWGTTRRVYDADVKKPKVRGEENR